MAVCTQKHVTFDTEDVAFPTVLRIPEQDPGKIRALRESKPPTPVSVGNSQNGGFKSHVNFHAFHDPMLQFCDSDGRSGRGPGFSNEKEATFVPKVTCFTVCFFADSHRLRAAAPYMCESSIVLSDSGSPGRHGNMRTKTRHFRHGGRHFLDSGEYMGGN